MTRKTAYAILSITSLVLTGIFFYQFLLSILGILQLIGWTPAIDPFTRLLQILVVLPLVLSIGISLGINAGLNWLLFNIFLILMIIFLILTIVSKSKKKKKGKRKK